MKRSLFALVFTVVSAILIFAFPSAQSMRVVLVGDKSGGTAARDQRMLSLVENTLRTFADHNHIDLIVSRLDSSQPSSVIATDVQSLADADLADVFIGCGDSACVRRVLPFAESHGINLIYPGSSEGLFKSHYLIHLGVVANQFLFPAVSWVRQHLGAKIFYVGSESARSRMMGRMLTNQLLLASGQPLIGEEYVGTLEQLPSILNKITVYKPDVVLFDACEWLWHPEFVRKIGEIPQRKFSLCVDQRTPALNNMYFISHYFDHGRNRLNAELRAHINDDPNALLSMALLATEFYISGWRKDNSNNTQEVDDYFKGRNAFTAAGSMAVDFHHEGSWHSIFIARKEGGDEKLLWISDGLMRPVMFSGLEAPSDWQHHLTIYWRNNGGIWRSGSVLGEPWL